MLADGGSDVTSEGAQPRQHRISLVGGNTLRPQALISLSQEKNHAVRGRSNKLIWSRALVGGKLRILVAWSASMWPAAQSRINNIKNSFFIFNPNE